MPGRLNAIGLRVQAGVLFIMAKAQPSDGV
jgi:hypothetical protein